MTFDAIKSTPKEVNSFGYANAKFSSAEGSRTDKPCSNTLILNGIADDL